MNVIILAEQDRIDQNHFRLCDHRAEHIRGILKLARGDKLEVGLLNTGLGQARIEKINDSEIIIQCAELTRQSEVSPGPMMEVICALPRPQTLKKVLITCGMMGVRRLYLIRAKRVEKSYFHSPLLKTENLQPYLIEGLSQGKMIDLPEVSIHDRFRPFFEDTLNLSKDGETTTPALRLFPHPECSDDITAVFSGWDQRILLAIGPEGGWVPFEIKVMQRAGFRMFKLGPWILRVEHALTASLAQIQLISSINHD